MKVEQPKKKWAILYYMNSYETTSHVNTQHKIFYDHYKTLYVKIFHLSYNVSIQKGS